ncbi:hypothetical protein, partial [Bifidobacterium longum]|uniref:hypothetical protein n=1 Tax=Bifidobacterium longum TaxID=216816 RepID=UPI0031B63E24
ETEGLDFFSNKRPSFICQSWFNRAKKLPSVIGDGMIGSPVKFAGEQLDKEVCDVMLHHSGA